jgi:hypothetical protein
MKWFPPLAFGATNGVPSNLASWLTSLVSSMSALNTVVSCVMVLRHMYVFGAYWVLKYPFHV